MANRYEELKQRQQKEFNQLPLGFAFCEKQFNEMMKGWGLDPEKDIDKIYRIPGGGFIQKKDHTLFHETMNKHYRETREAIEADPDGTGFVCEMFVYELDNHEYGYTGELGDTLDALGIEWEKILTSKKFLTGLKKAQQIILNRELSGDIL